MKRALGARLAGWTALATVLAVLVCVAVSAAVVWTRESSERGSDDRDAQTDESPADESVDTAAVMLAAAVPVLLVTALVARRLARRVTDRVDIIVTAATRMTHERLDERLPVSAADDELDELARALNAVFARLEQGLAAQQQFVADASHELRTPLTVLRNDLEVARRRPRSPEEWEALADRARDEVARMTAMVEALLRLARTDATAPTSARVELAGLVEDVAARWRAAADAAKVRLEITADDAALAGDADALAVALGNLVGNAIAHSPAGGHIAIAATHSRDAVEITVSDQGPGIAAADRERIFLPFARGATAADRGGADGGVGLGLSVARRIVEAHRGTIAVDDAPGAGARFVIRLPG